MKIFGKVLDIDELPMSLANVTSIEKVNGVFLHDEADLDGNFTILNNSINPDSKFRISYVGYVPQFFKASQLQGKNIKLLEDTIALDELVIRAGGKPTDNKPEPITSKKGKFALHLQDHKFVYAGLGGLAGILLIVKALKK